MSSPTPPLQPDEELRDILEDVANYAMNLGEPGYLITNYGQKSLQEVMTEAVSKLEAREQAARIVSRFEVIDHTEGGTGREFVKWLSNDFKVEFDLQDDGRTLKVFLTDAPSNRKAKDE